MLHEEPKVIEEIPRVESEPKTVPIRTFCHASEDFVVVEDEEIEEETAVLLDDANDLLKRFRVTLVAQLNLAMFP